MIKKFLEKIISWLVRNRIAVPLIQSWDWLHKKISCLVINSIVSNARARPHPWSTLHSYTSWDSLTDKTWSARHLPEKEGSINWKPESELAEFFRNDGEQKLSEKSTCLFPAFAQHLTDGFIRTRMPKDDKEQSVRLRNTSNHNIDLSPLYGRTIEQTNILRMHSTKKGERGRLKYQECGGEIYAPFLFDATGNYSEGDFAKLDPPLALNMIKDDSKKKQSLFAFGGDRANAAPQVAMINTLFLREHNRLAGELEEENPDWSDERVFQTARNAIIVLYIKIVVEEYINHISSVRLRLIADPSVAWRAKWNRPNWITTEFSLLYRWHSLVPTSVTWDRDPYPTANTILNNQPLLKNGLKNSFIELSEQPSAQLGSFNTAPSLLAFEERAIAQGRLVKLATYNDYREYVDLPRAQSFDQISTNPDVVGFLAEHYERADDVEFYVGLFAEDLNDNSPLPELMTRMVGLDAFSQALTNPLLSKPVFEQKEKVFGKAGWKAIQETSSLRDVLARNCEGLSSEFIGMTLPTT